MSGTTRELTASVARASEKALELHPTVKPVGLVADAILDSTKRNDIILDPYIGSGTTILAAERTGRRCFWHRDRRAIRRHRNRQMGTADGTEGAKHSRPDICAGEDGPRSQSVSAPPNDHEIGYGHPPKQTRWKKGQSGNPGRRYPARSKGTVEMIDRLFLKPVEITVNGKTKTVSTLEAIVLQLWLKEVSGDRRALNVRLKYQEFARQNTEPRLEITFVDNEYTLALASANSTASTDHG